MSHPWRQGITTACLDRTRWGMKQVKLPRIVLCGLDRVALLATLITRSRATDRVVIIGGLE
jgi:hypothetical protein